MGDTLHALRSGERLDRMDFERRFDATPGLKLAELINGEVFIHPSQTYTFHGGPRAKVVGWLGVYHAGTPGTTCGASGHIRFGDRDMYQPAAVLFIHPSRGGGAQITEDDYLAGSPELVAEIVDDVAAAVAARKRETYRCNDVREYVVWRTYDRAIDFLVLREGQYQPLAPDDHGIIRSEVFPGLWLAPAALLAGDLATVLRVVQEGLASSEHRDFVERLKQV